MFNTAIRNIIDLLKIKKDAKKTDLDIDKLERDKKKEEARIQLASFEDVRRYDPKVRDLYERYGDVAKHHAESPGYRERRYRLPRYHNSPRWVWILEFAFVIGAIYFLVRLVWF